MHLGLRLIVFLSGLSFALAARAASVDSIEGRVLINRGNGYQQMAGPSQAHVGDTLMASPGSSAKLRYGDGCTVAVLPGSIVTVGSVSPCGALVGSEPPPPLNEESILLDNYLIVGAVVGGGVGAAILSTDNGDRRVGAPASP